MNRFHGYVLIVNALLPAIVAAVLIAAYAALVSPAMDDARRLRASLQALDAAADRLREQTGRTGDLVEARIRAVRKFLAPVRAAYSGVGKLSDDFCGNIGRADLWSARAGVLRLARVEGAPAPGRVFAAVSVGGLVGGARDLGERALGKLRGQGERAGKFARSGACRTTQAAFEGTYTVLGTVMAPLQEIDESLEEFGVLYAALEPREAFAALARIGGRIASLAQVLGYLVLGLAAWFLIQYLSWARARLRQGWALIRR